MNYGLTKSLKLLADLEGQLTCWGQHQSEEPLRIFEERVQDGKGKGTSLA